MRLNKTLLGLGLAATLAACGTDKKKDDAANDQQPQAPAAEAATPERDAMFSNIPGTAIIRVKLDDNGQPASEPEMKVVENHDALQSADAVATAFDQARAVDELDSDTSTQSWSRGYGSCSGGYGCYNSGYLGGIRPVLYYGGYGWNYGAYGSYRRGGYSYYCYRPSYGYSYGGYGYPGYGSGGGGYGGGGYGGGGYGGGGYGSGGYGSGGYGY